MPMSDWTQLTTDLNAASGVYLWFVNIAKQVATTTPAIYGRAGWIPIHHQPCGRAGCLHDKHNGRARAGCCTPFHLTQYSFCKCRTVRHPASPVPDWKRRHMPEPVRYLNKRNLVRYRTEMSDAGMPMTGLMPMPFFVLKVPIILHFSDCTHPKVCVKKFVNMNILPEERKSVLVIKKKILNVPSCFYLFYKFW